MKCKNCGRELVTGTKFCMFCGTKVGVSCPKCGTELPDEARFCFNCGTEVKSSLGEQPATPKTILDPIDMEWLSQLAEQQKEPQESKGAPVWDKTSTGVCDCAVGECDCDGSIWS